MLIVIIAIISAGHGGGDRGMRCKKFVTVVRVVVPRAPDAMWQSCTTTACNRIACAGIRAVPSDKRHFVLPRTSRDEGGQKSSNFLVRVSVGNSGIQKGVQAKSIQAHYSGK